MKTVFIFLASVLISFGAFSQTILQGNLSDAETGEPIIFGTVALYQQGVLITGVDTDFDGFYSVTELNAGTYDVVFSYTGYQDFKVTNLVIQSGKPNRLNAKMSAGVEMILYCPSWCPARPLISRDDLTQGFKFDAREISRIGH